MVERAIKNLCRTLGQWAFLGVVCVLAQELPGPRLDPPAAPIHSRNGMVVVHAPRSKAGYRMPVLTFVNQCSEALQRTLKLKFGSQSCPLEIMIGGQSNGDPNVTGRRLREKDGSLRERIELADPEAADLWQFQRMICRALLRAWMVEAGGTEQSMRDLPLWLVDGVLRCGSREMRQVDVDRTLLLWSNACLPAACELFAMDSMAATREVAVAAVLTSWLLEKRDGKSLFETILRAAATGQEWSPAGVAQLLTGSGELDALDAWSDRKMLAERRLVIRPGTTSSGSVRRFRHSLLLYPEFFGKYNGLNRVWCTLQQAARQSGDPAVRKSALEQAMRVRMAAFGCDGTLIAVAEAYAQFLEALAKGGKPGELARMLLQAEALRAEVEARTAIGEILEAEAKGQSGL